VGVGYVPSKDEESTLRLAQCAAFGYRPRNQIRIDQDVLIINIVYVMLTLRPALYSIFPNYPYFSVLNNVIYQVIVVDSLHTDSLLLYSMNIHI